MNDEQKLAKQEALDEEDIKYGRKNTQYLIPDIAKGKSNNYLQERYTIYCVLLFLYTQFDKNFLKKLKKILKKHLHYIQKFFIIEASKW